jgi:hypothetical protein
MGTKYNVYKKPTFWELNDGGDQIGYEEILTNRRGAMKTKIEIERVANGYIVTDGKRTMISGEQWYNLEKVLRDMVEYNEAEGEGGNG